MPGIRSSWRTGERARTHRRRKGRRRSGPDAAANTRFHNRFVRQEDLVAFLSAADIYATPNLNVDPIPSATLARAIGSGKAVISTPYPTRTRESSVPAAGAMCGAKVPFGNRSRAGNHRDREKRYTCRTR